jgi:hypothetical protein
MASNPKLEFYKFQLNPSNGKNKTFRDFAIEELKADKKVSNDDAFKMCFAHFIKAIETKHAKSEKKKKTITIIANSKTNPYLSSKPAPNNKKHTISGVINGGPYDKDAIVSDIANKEDNSILGKNKSILLPYFVFVYLPPDYHQGFFAIHSNSADESVTAIFRSYISNLFSGSSYNKAIPEAFCPQSFQDEFRKGAVIKNLTFSTTIIDTSHSTDPIQSLLQAYSIKIEATPKGKGKAISISSGQKVIDFFEKKIFKAKKDKELTLKQFTNKSLLAKNDVTKKTKVFQWDKKDDEFVPTILLTNRIKMKDGTPDFEDLKKFCNNIFESEILTEIRPDLNAKKVK